MFLNSLKSILRPLTVLPQSVLSTTSSFHTGQCVFKVEDRKMMLASVPKKDEGTQGEKSIAIDSLISTQRAKVFPDETIHASLINGIEFNKIPVCNIRVTKNNTVISIAEHDGVPKLIRSCGIEGFKNARKGTNIAAQATAISISGKALERGYKQVRVQIRGIGPGRMSAIKGLQMGGLNVVSITDCTRVTYNPLRARKQRKL